MQTVSTNICERMGHSQELSEFQCGTVIGCHLCNKSSHEISSRLNIPKATVSGIITKWKRLGKTAITTDLQTSCGLQVNSRTVCRELHGMCFHGWAAAAKPYISKCNAKCRTQWCKARHHWTLEQWRRVLWSDESCFPILQSDGRVWVWQMPGEWYLSDCIVPSVMFGWGGIVVWGYFSGAGLGSLVPVKVNSDYFSIPRDAAQFHAPNFVGTVWLMAPSCSNMTARQCTRQGPQRHGWESFVWMYLTSTWPQPDRPPLGWIRA